MHDKKSIQTQERRRKEEDDWLGLGDEFVNDANEQQNYSIGWYCVLSYSCLGMSAL